MNYHNTVNKNDIYDINNFYIGQLLINLCDNQEINDLLNKKYIIFQCICKIIINIVNHK